MTFAQTEHITLENLTNRLIEEYKYAKDFETKERIDYKTYKVCRELPDKYARQLYSRYFEATTLIN
jgi:hypothetical protein